MNKNIRLNLFNKFKHLDCHSAYLPAVHAYKALAKEEPVESVAIKSKSGMLPEKVAMRKPCRASSHDTKHSPICLIS